MRRIGCTRGPKSSPRARPQAGARTFVEQDGCVLTIGRTAAAGRQHGGWWSAVPAPAGTPVRGAVQPPRRRPRALARALSPTLEELLALNASSVTCSTTPDSPPGSPARWRGRRPPSASRRGSPTPTPARCRRRCAGSPLHPHGLLLGQARRSRAARARRQRFLRSPAGARRRCAKAAAALAADQVAAVRTDLRAVGRPAPPARGLTRRDRPRGGRRRGSGSTRSASDRRRRRAARRSPPRAAGAVLGLRRRRRAGGGDAGRRGASDHRPASRPREMPRLDELVREVVGDTWATADVANLLLSSRHGPLDAARGPPGRRQKSSFVPAFFARLGHGPGSGVTSDGGAARLAGRPPLFGFWHPTHRTWEASSEGFVEPAARRPRQRQRLRRLLSGALLEVNLASPSTTSRARSRPSGRLAHGAAVRPGAGADQPRALPASFVIPDSDAAARHRERRRHRRAPVAPLPPAAPVRLGRARASGRAAVAAGQRQRASWCAGTPASRGGTANHGHRDLG